MKEVIIKAFLSQFNATPEVIVKAPGRINIIGEHTDYNEGYVLPASIDKYILFALSAGGDQHEVYSIDFDKMTIFSPSITSSTAESTWEKYIQAIILQLNLRGHESVPIKAVFGGNIPQGGGMSSSAALCCGLIFALNELNDWDITRKQMAIIAQAAEHSIGINCGLMDQFASLFGKKDEVMLLDCKTLQTKHFAMNLGDYKVCLINSMQKHEFATDSAYNERRASCESTVALIKKDYSTINSLRDVSLAILSQYKDKLDETSYLRCEYVIEENARVQSMVKALESGDLSTVGTLLKQAHEGMKSKYQITTIEIDFLADFVNNYSGALGARMMGGGFGGCTINIIHNDSFDACTNALVAAYKQKFNRDAEIYALSIQDGVNVL